MLPPTVPGNGSFFFGCPTTPYSADGGELAIISVKASCGVPTGQGLGVAVGRGLNGGAPATFGAYFYLSNGSANTEDLKNDQLEQTTLNAGVTYVFATGVTNAAGAPYAPASPQEGAYCYCHTLVQIFQ